MTLAVSGISFPAFALGMVLMQMFSVKLGWLPTVGDDQLEELRAAVAHARRGGGGNDGAFHALVVRRHAAGRLHPHRARQGSARDGCVIIKHGLRNAMIPVVTMMGLQFGFLLGGSIVVEVVFNWPGMGRLLVDAVDMRDYPGDPGRSAAVLAGVHSHQPGRRRAVRRHQPDDPLSSEAPA